MTDLHITPSQLSGTIVAPPSKSHSIRAILCGTMAQGTSKIEGILPSPDIDAAINAGRQLGAIIEVHGQNLEICGVAGRPKTPSDVINAGNSGIVLRFVGALAALTNGYTVLTGDHSVRTLRPVQPLIEGLQGLGAFACSTRNNERAPIIVRGPLHPGTTHLQGQDSQPVSALLLAAPFIEGTTVIRVQDPGELPWIRVTLNWLDRLQVPYLVKADGHYEVYGPYHYAGFHYRVAGDFSSAAFPLAAALLTNSSITISNLDFTDSQGDKKLFDILSSMGAHFKYTENSVQVLPSSRLIGRIIDVNDVIDAGPILAVIACFAQGETRLMNGAIARQKESDRWTSIATELRKMGANIQELPDGLVIQPSKLTGAVVQSHKDHRLAMSLAIAGLVAQGKTQVKEAEVISKSYPGFAPMLQSLQAKVRLE